MKNAINAILPAPLLEQLLAYKQFLEWKKRGYLGNSPQSVKQHVFMRYGITGAPWVETGTYLGTTTAFLSNHFPLIYSIEPSLELYTKAVHRFEGSNVMLYNGVSEDILPTLLPMLSGDINFWLDGHYSAGITFRGHKECPVEDELDAIHDNIDNFSKITILIDDVRCFLPRSNDYSNYPSIDYLVDWARAHQFWWRIEHDIFVMKNH